MKLLLAALTLFLASCAAPDANPGGKVELVPGGGWERLWGHEPEPAYRGVPINKAGRDYEHEDWLRRFRHDYYNPPRWRYR